MPTSILLTITLNKSESNHSGEQNSICSRDKNQSKKQKECFLHFLQNLNFGITADSSSYLRSFPHFI